MLSPTIQVSDKIGLVLSQPQGPHTIGYLFCIILSPQRGGTVPGMGSTPAIVLCDESEGPKSVDFQLIKGEIIPGCSPYKGSEIWREKERFSSAGFKEANNHAIWLSTWLGPERGWPQSCKQTLTERLYENKALGPAAARD